jgi:hypothetical protein
MDNSKTNTSANAQIDEKELEIAQEEAKEEGRDTFVHKFKKPFEYNGKKYEHFEFDFNSLTGGDSLAVEEEIQREGKGVVVVGAFNSEYLIRIAARACLEPISYDAFKYMSLFDYNKIRDRTRNFLLRSEQ